MEKYPIDKKKVLYIGGFELPDKNAAAQRVIGIAKSLRDLGYEVCFVNSVKGLQQNESIKKEYFGFDTIEYGRETDLDYLVTGTTAIKSIEAVSPDYIIAYNYPALALERIRFFCSKKGIKCIGDATEWYDSKSGNIVFRMIKSFDTWYRMTVVHKKLDGIIAISRYLFDYYKDSVNTVLIPPTVDITDDKWQASDKKQTDVVTFVYAGSPSAQKEKLDLIVETFGSIPKYYCVKLYIIGVSKAQFIDMYSWKHTISERISFLGRLEHKEALQIVKQSNWTIILRENNSVVKAGFPTKLVESISCGIPVLVNRFSNIDEYLSGKNSIIVNSVDKLSEYIEKACEEQKSVDNSVFDFRLFLEELEKLFVVMEL